MRIVKFKPSDILRYELSFLPLFLVSFVIFFPVTLHVRYLLRRFPNYDFNQYKIYLHNAISLDTYLLYLPFVLILGYTLINISLIRDFMDNLRKVVSTSETIMTTYPLQTIPHQPTPVLPLTPTQQQVVLKKDFIESITAKNDKGDVVLSIADCYYFETDGKYIDIHHPNGVYKRLQRLSYLEEELNPACFFKISRQLIINLQFVKSFTYWDKGKYIIHLDTPHQSTVVMPRAQIQQFKEALSNFVVISN